MVDQTNLAAQLGGPKATACKGAGLSSSATRGTMDTPSPRATQAVIEAMVSISATSLSGISNRIFDVVLAAGFGLPGYAFRKANASRDRCCWALSLARCLRRTCAGPWSC